MQDSTYSTVGLESEGLLFTGDSEMESQKAGGLSVLQYLIVLGVAGFISLTIIYFCRLIDATFVGLTVAGIILVGLTLWRVEVGLFILVALVPWEMQSMLSSSFTAVKAVGAVVAPIGLIFCINSRGPRWPSAFKAAFCLGIWAMFGSIAYASVPSLWYLSSLLLNISMAYLIMRFTSKPAAMYALLIVLVLSSLAQAIWGLAGYSGGMSEGTRMSVAGDTSEDVNINTYVRYLFPAIFLVPALMARAKLWALRLLLLPVMGIGLLAAVLTVSRGASLGIVVGAFVLLMTCRFRWHTKLGVVIGAVILVGGALLVANSLGAMDVWVNRISGKTFWDDLDTRFALWGTALRIGLDHPILGVGMGNEFYHYYMAGFARAAPHNDILAAFMLTGFPGLTMFITLVALVTVSLWRMSRGMMRSCQLGMWIAMLITGLFNPSFTTKVFWVNVGICLIAAICDREEREARELQDYHLAMLSQELVNR